MLKRKIRTTPVQLKAMANNWIKNPEMAAANVSGNIWQKLTASLRMATKATLAFNDSCISFFEALEPIEKSGVQFDRMMIDLPGVTHINIKPDAPQETVDAVQKMVKIAYNNL